MGSKSSKESKESTRTKPSITRPKSASKGKNGLTTNSQSQLKSQGQEGSTISNLVPNSLLQQNQLQPGQQQQYQPFPQQYNQQEQQPQYQTQQLQYPPQNSIPSQQPNQFQVPTQSQKQNDYYQESSIPYQPPPVRPGPKIQDIPSNQNLQSQRKTAMTTRPGWGDINGSTQNKPIYDIQKWKILIEK
jgi:hypothetical protein